MEAAIQALKMGKSAGVDNIPTELVQAGGEAMIDILTSICNKICKTGDWPTRWSQSLVITLPKEGNLQLCQNYRTISLTSHPSKVMLKIDHPKQTPVTRRRDHCRRARRKEHHRTNIQSQDPLREIYATSAESLQSLYRLQEGL